MTRSESPTTPASRLHVIDGARGAALLGMFVYHFAWDLDFYELIAIDTGAGGWAVFARVVACSFLFLVGVSLVLATRDGFRPKLFLRRLGLVAGAAMLVTLATWWLTPDSFIYFGILHCIAVSSVLALPFLRLPVWSVLAAAFVCFVAPFLFAGPSFDAPWLHWLGLMSYFPDSNDYVPLLPWFGAVLLGIAAARLALPSSTGAWAQWKPANPGARLLAWSGRHSLALYLLHQPLLLTALYFIA